MTTNGAIALVLCTIMPVFAQLPNQTTSSQRAAKNSYIPPLSTNVATLLRTGNVLKNNVRFENVASAMPDADFREAVAYVKSQWWINVVPTNSQKSIASKVLAEKQFLSWEFGDKTRLVIQLVKDKKAPNIVAVPGYYAQVNLEAIEADNPAPEYLKKRRIQMIIKGLAYACGVGSNADEFCVMYYKGDKLSVMDCSSATFSPFAYVPLREYLFAIGGEEIFDYME
jgi:hypothetical protein